ncbi:MAG: LysR family transcriptional regulator [Labrys sp. (in: a-proteobacteria)]
MSDISSSELRRLDLTLLLVLLGLIRRRKSAEVAAELGLTQSAISQGLRRLRDIFGDDLFLRRPHGMEPTARALALEEPVARAVDALREALGGAREFDPSRDQAVVRIAALDAEQSVLVPPFADHLSREAPNLRLSVLPLGRGAAIEALIEGRVDLALGFIWDRPDTIRSEKLYEESFLVAGRPSVLPDAPRLDLDRYCASDHVLIAPGGDMRGVVDDRLEAMGRRRRVVLGLPAFLPALAAVAASATLVTLPARVALAFASGFGLVTATPPIDVRHFPVSVFWHRRNDKDGRTVWLRRQLLTCAAQRGRGD